MKKRRVTIYLDLETLKFHKKRAIELDYNSFSKYVEELLQT